MPRGISAALDTVVRRRLAQKLAFLLEDTVRVAEPPEAELPRRRGDMGLREFCEIRWQC